MSWLRSILDAALRTTGRLDLRMYGREIRGDEDHLLPQDDRDRVLARCHDLRRNNPVGAGVDLCLQDNVVGDALRLQARSSDSAWNEEAESWLRVWAQDPCDGRGDLTDVAKLIVSSRLYDGELLLVPQSDGHLAMVESERIRPPAGSTDELAYRLDSRGRVSAWHVADRDEHGELGASAEGRWVADAIHVTRRWRPDQVRGWPELATVANCLADVGEINSANLRKSKMGAMAAWVLSGGGTLQGRNAVSAATTGARPLNSFSEGMIYELPPGQSLQQFVANQPGGEYGPFVQLQLQLVCMALRLPYEFVLAYWSNGNFASSKACLLQARKTIHSWQAWLWRSAIAPILQWRVALAVADGEIAPAPVDARGRSEWDRWAWQLPAEDWVDPQDATQSEMQQVRMGVASMDDVCASHGVDAEEVARANARYLQMVRRVAAEYGVSPQELHDIQISGQAPVAPAGQQADDGRGEEGGEP